MTQSSGWGSLTPPSPDWWQASDGLWYPPETSSLAAPTQAAQATPVTQSDWAPQPIQPADVFAGPLFAPPVGQGMGSPYGSSGGQLGLAAEVGLPPQRQGSDIQPPPSAIRDEWGVGRSATGTARTSRKGSGLVVIAVALVVVLAVAGTISAVTLSGSHSAVPTTTAPGSAVPTSTRPPGPTLTRLGSAAWSDPSLKLASGQILADGRMLAIAEAPARGLRLIAVDPSTGRVMWSQPYAQSFITAGVELEPIAVDGVALALDPYPSASSGVVRIQGVSVVTGKVVWALPGVAAVLDVPGTCANGQVFCVDIVTSDSGAGGLEMIRPKTGLELGFISGPERAMFNQLYETSDSPPTLAQVGASGSIAWTRSVSSLFGSSSFSPDYGWDFTQLGTLEIGTISQRPKGKVYSFAGSETVGVSVATGAVAWRVSGQYDCEGALWAEDPFLCQLTGSETDTGGTPVSHDVTMRINGFVAATGKATWSQSVLNPEKLLDGKGIVQDSHHVVIGIPGKGLEVLDTLTGTLRPVSSSTRYWCVSQMTVPIVAVKGAVGKERAGGATADTCSASGHDEGGLPTYAWTDDGVTAGGLFMWPSAHGLEAAHLVA
jgi:outer membrane protein assembly factor BamB